MQVYFALVLTAVLLPYALPEARRNSEQAAKYGQMLALIVAAGGALILTLSRGGLMVPGAVLLIMSGLGYGWRSILGALAATGFLAAALWWFPEIELSQYRQMLVATACGIIALLARKCRFETSLEAPNLRHEPVIIGSLVLAGMATGLLTGAVNAEAQATMTWHHWGAYLSPVMPMLAGGVPFQDFPVQYGMGPTMMLASACNIGDCWHGLYWVTIFANALYLAVCGWSCLVLTRGYDWPSRVLVLAALACASWIWAGSPNEWGNPIMTPSTGGLRFLPLAALLAFILAIESRVRSGISAKYPLMAGHFLWFVGVFWSPENAFFTTLLWWPWQALRRADGLVGIDAKAKVLVGTALRAIIAIVVGYALLEVLFRIRFGQWVSLADFLLYIEYPPGRLPVKERGAIWLAGSAILFALIAIFLSTDMRARRRLYAVLLTSLAAGSYYLSRSHDNNILNLMPFLILLLVAAHAAWPSQFMSGFLRACMAGIIALTTTMNFQAWTVLPAGSSVAGLQIGPDALISRFSPERKDVPLLVAPDAALAIADLRRQGNDAVLLFDGKKIMPAFNPAASWTGVNNPANFLPLPTDIVSRQISRGAKRFRRAGWLVMTEFDTKLWLSVFELSYTVTERRKYGGYTAYHLAPRDVR